MTREILQKTFPLWLFTGFLFIAVSIPLILDKVPPNAWYGFRVAKTFANERIWYIANREAGYNLLYAGMTIALTAVVTKLLFNKYGLSDNIFNSVNLFIFIFALMLAIARSFFTLNMLA